MSSTKDKKSSTNVNLLRLRRSAQITLTTEIRRQFKLSEGDYLEAEAVQSGILLKPITVVKRSQARVELSRIMKRVHAKQESHAKSPKKEEEIIAGEIKAFRKLHA